MRLRPGLILLFCLQPDVHQNWKIVPAFAPAGRPASGLSDFQAGLINHEPKLIPGFALLGVVQAVVSRKENEPAPDGRPPRTLCLGQVIEHLGAKPQECFFWATHAGAELDLLIVRGPERRGFEFKRTSEPALTPSMRIALEDLKLDSLEVVHAGKDAFPLARNVRAVPLARLLEVAPLRGMRN